MRVAERRSWFGRIRNGWGEAYRADTWSHVARSVVAVPIAVREVVRAGGRRPASPRSVARALVAVPVAIAATALTGLLGFVVLINVVAYPFRGFLGLPGRTGDIWASEYHDSWGGPTLAGAWAVHAALALFVVMPALALAVRGLIGVQRRLSRTSPESSTVQPVSAARAARPRRTGPEVGPRLLLRRSMAAAAALALVVGSSLAAHSMGIGDNILWTPRDLASSVALAVTSAPLIGLLIVSRTRWWRRAR